MRKRKGIIYIDDDIFLTEELWAQICKIGVRCRKCNSSPRLDEVLEFASKGICRRCTEDAHDKAEELQRFMAQMERGPEEDD